MYVVFYSLLDCYMRVEHLILAIIAWLYHSKTPIPSVTTLHCDYMLTTTVMM